MALQREREALSDALEKMQDELIKSEERCETYRSQENGPKIAISKFGLILTIFKVASNETTDQPSETILILHY